MILFELIKGHFCVMSNMHYILPANKFFISTFHIRESIAADS